MNERMSFDGTVSRVVEPLEIGILTSDITLPSQIKPFHQKEDNNEIAYVSDMQTLTNELSNKFEYAIFLLAPIAIKEEYSNGQKVKEYRTVVEIHVDSKIINNGLMEDVFNLERGFHPLLVDFVFKRTKNTFEIRVIKNVYRIVNIENFDKKEDGSDIFSYLDFGTKNSSAAVLSEDIP